jgi:hypothetical protein
MPSGPTEELLSVLRGYLAGEISRRDLYLYAVGFNWSDGDPATAELESTIAGIELFTEEVAEGIRDEAELRDLAEGAVEALTSGRCAGLTADRSGQRRHR